VKLDKVCGAPGDLLTIRVPRSPYYPCVSPSVTFETVYSYPGTITEPSVGPATLIRATNEVDDDQLEIVVKLPANGSGPMKATLACTDQYGSVQRGALGTITSPCPPPDAGPTPMDAGVDSAVDAGPDTRPPFFGHIVVETRMQDSIKLIGRGQFNVVSAANETKLATTRAGLDKEALQSQLAVGSCGAYYFPNDSSPTLEGLSIGTPIALLDGSTTVMPLEGSQPGKYLGSQPPGLYDKTLAATIPGAGPVPQTSLTPFLRVPVQFEVTAPKMVGTAPVVITRGQPLTVTWTPFDTGVFVLHFIGQNQACKLDSKAGTFTVPATFTSTLDIRNNDALELQASSTSSATVMVDGQPRGLDARGSVIHRITTRIQ